MRPPRSGRHHYEPNPALHRTAAAAGDSQVPASRAAAAGELAGVYSDDLPLHRPPGCYDGGPSFNGRSLRRQFALIARQPRDPQAAPGIAANGGVEADCGERHDRFHDGVPVDQDVPGIQSAGCAA